MPKISVNISIFGNHLPATKDPKMPPIAKHEPIHDASSSVIDSPNSWCLSFEIRVVGKPILHPQPNVAADAAKVARTCRARGVQVNIFGSIEICHLSVFWHWSTSHYVAFLNDI